MHPELTMFKELIDKEAIYPLMLNSWSMTIFAPTNQAMKNFIENNPSSASFDADLFKYHIAGLPIKREEFSNSPVVSSFAGQFAPLYLSMLESNENSPMNNQKSYFVNNALINAAIEDLKTSNGQDQALYIIDEVLSVFKPSKSVAPTAFELIKEPSLYGLDNIDLTQFASHIESNKLDSIFSSPGLHTFFVPSKIESRGTPDFDLYVVKAHVVENKALFLRTMGDRRNYKTMAHDEKIDVEVSFINKTLRFTSEKMHYVQSNTIKNDAVHKAGRVLSRMILANIPIKNGVMHIIEKPLMLMDMSIRDFLREQTKLKRFHGLLEKHPDVLSELNRHSNKTVLAPDDNAFANLVDNNQKFAGIDENSEEMKKLLRQHLVYQQVSSSDLRRNAGYANLSSASNIPVVFRLIGIEPHSRLTVESGDVNATSLMSDIGASDGILHIIDRVLGMPFNSILEKVIDNPLLNSTLNIGSQGGTQNWNTKLADQNKRYTFFAPSNQAWSEFSLENPSEFKQLDNGIYPSISRTILDRHLSAKGQFNKKDLEQSLKKVDTIQGELLIIPDAKTREIYVEWEGKKAKIIESDIYGLNGVVHIIDKVLAKRRDFKVNSAPNIHCHQSPLLSILSFVCLCLMHWKLSQHS
ncbi:fasciclin-1-like protein [Sarcoptes scabiei]|nr:fasciclin-1-like protein [Sarcoptes scabiei]